MSRLFDGQFSVESVTFAVGNAPPDQGPITMGSLFRPQSSFNPGTGYLLNGQASGTDVWSLLYDNGKPFIANDFGTGGPTLTALTWYWLVATKASGSVIPRWHVGTFTGSAISWVHQNDTQNVGDGTGPITTLIVGNSTAAGAADLRGELAASVAWDTAMADLTVEATFTLNASDLAAATPKWGVLWNQASTATAATDFTGGGGNQTAISGTSVSANEPPGWSYSLSATAVPRQQPLVVTAAAPAPRPAALLVRPASIVVAPSVATPKPLVVTTPAVTGPSTPILVRRSLVDDPVLTTVRPLVVTTSPVRPGAAAIVARSTLADPPVLTTAGPIVVTALQPSPAAAAILARNPQPAAAIVSGPVTEPIVVTQPSPPPASAGLTLRAHLQDAIVATASPIVVTQPGPVRASQPILARGSLADLLAATEPLVVTAPVVVARGAALTVRNAAPPPVAGPSGPVTEPVVVTAVTAPVRGLAVLLRSVAAVCDGTPRPLAGTTPRPFTAVTSRPYTVTTTRPSSCS